MPTVDPNISSHTNQHAAKPAALSGTAIGWFVSFLLFPYGPFVYIRRLRAISPAQIVAFLAASALVHIGLVSVLAQTNGVAWQPWLVLLLGAGHYCLGLFQFCIGQQHGLWNKQGIRLWRIFGWLGGILLVVDLLSQLVIFHLAQVPR